MNVNGIMHTPHLDDFKDVFDHGAMEEKKKFMGQFVKEIRVNPRGKTAKIRLYENLTYDMIMGVKSCDNLVEINYP